MLYLLCSRKQDKTKPATACLTGKTAHMTDNKNKPYELCYLQEKFGVSPEGVQATMDAPGNDRDKVEQYLKQKR